MTVEKESSSIPPKIINSKLPKYTPPASACNLKVRGTDHILEEGTDTLSSNMNGS